MTDDVCFVDQRNFQRIFKLANATMASRAAQIQKRVTMRVSGSPFSTK